MVKNYGAFREMPIRRIEPDGWLKEFLIKQRDGLTGHIEASGAPFDRVFWDATDEENEKRNGGAPGWWSFEQTAYHLDGAERLSLLLRDRGMHRRMKKTLYTVLDRADPDGYLGPENLKKTNGWNRWPHVVFFRALWAEYLSSGDTRIPRALCAHYLGGSAAFDVKRDVINVEPMLLAYLETGNRELLKLAVDSFRSYNERCTDDNCARAQLSPRKPYAHGVTYNEYSKLGALLYICTGDRSYLKPSIAAYKKIDRFDMLPDGLHCSNEFLLDNDYMQSHETCDISDYTWSLGYMLAATGDGAYADKIEKCVFNAGIGSVEENFRALQYFSCPNQLVLDGTSNHNDFFRGSAWMSYRPNPGTECCAGNVHRFMPNYCARMWMKKGRAAVAALYGPSSCTFGAGQSACTIREETDYPFSDTVRFSFRLKKERKFSFVFRVPGWCASPTVTVNGEAVDCTPKKGFCTLDRVWREGDTVTLELPAQAEFFPFGDGVCVRRGPLLFALGMKGKRSADDSAPTPDQAFPALKIYPDRPFNYALLTDRPPVFRRARCKNDPFSFENVCCFVTVRAVKIPSWKITAKKSVSAVHDLYTRPWKREKKTGVFTFTPRYPSRAVIEKEGVGKSETLTLIPYGAAKVRVSVFPVINKRPPDKGAL